jgi:hypothetical protein
MYATYLSKSCSGNHLQYNSPYGIPANFLSEGSFINQSYIWEWASRRGCRSAAQCECTINICLVLMVSRSLSAIRFHLQTYDVEWSECILDYPERSKCILDYPEWSKCILDYPMRRHLRLPSSILSHFVPHQIYERSSREVGVSPVLILALSPIRLPSLPTSTEAPNTPVGFVVACWRLEMLVQSAPPNSFSKHSSPRNRVTTGHLGGG